MKLNNEHFGNYLETFIMNTGLSGAEFAKRIDVNRSRITELKKRKDLPRLKTVWKIQQEFPDFLPEVGKSARNKKVNELHGFMSVPLLNHHVYGDYIKRNLEPNFINELPKFYVSQEFEGGNYMVFEIRDDSMQSASGTSINLHDKLLAKEIPNDLWRSVLGYKKYLFILISESGVFCKQILNFNAESGEFDCHGFNPISQDTKFNIRDLKKLFVVKKLVERTLQLQ